ncbi:hypothetical protein [Endozoicomonas sp.]|uniref:hypothetical protein n=1 Tax=Endozoicomonas sp. TaxID=1892382 RepID=UPI003D9B44A6
MVLLIFYPSYGHAGWNLTTYDGKVIPFGDRPALITTWAGRETLFLDPAMADPENAIGFLDFAGIFKEPFSHIPSTMMEAISMQRTRHNLMFFKKSGQPLDYNGRVILKVHGTKTGQVGFQFGEHANQLDRETLDGTVVFDMYDVAVRLKVFFRRFNIPVKQVDLYVCCDDEAGTITQRFYEGFQDAFQNILIRGFKSVVGAVGKSGQYLNFQITTNEDDPRLAVSLPDFMVRAKLPDNPEAKKHIIEKTKGNPEPVEIPETPKMKQECDRK